MVFTNIKEITSFTKIIVKVGNHKYMKLVKKIGLNVYSPLKYSVNTINKKNLNIPRCRINPKKKRLRRFPCCPLGALVRSERTWPMEQSTLERTWAWVGQVDLF